MSLTGRFRFRRSMLGSVILQLEHDRSALWPLWRRHAWRDARIVDLLQPQLHGLLELEHFVEEFPNANHGALAVPLTRRRLPQREQQREQPQAQAVAGPKPDPACGTGSFPFRYVPSHGRPNGGAPGTAEPAPI